MTESANILIVDDIEVNRTVLHDLVLSLGHTPKLAENGISALEQIHEQVPDIVLLDIRMPDMDGYEVLQQVKDNFLLQHIPIIMITAVDDIDSTVKCIEMGAEDYLVKPFNRVLLKARIAACLEKKYLHDLEENHHRQIEELNQSLEKRVREKTQELADKNEKLQIINKTKTDFLKLVSHEVHKQAKDAVDAVKTASKEGFVKRLQNIVKQSVIFEQVDLNPKFYLEPASVHHVMKYAVKFLGDFAKSRQVLIGQVPDCGKPGPTQSEWDMAIWASQDAWVDEVGFVEKSFDYIPPAVKPKSEQDGQSPSQKETFFAKAFIELLKTAIILSNQDNTINLSCQVTATEIEIKIDTKSGTIPEETISQFFEVSTQPVMQDEGIDMGPSVAKRIITLLNGSVTIENQEYIGVLITVKLKLAEPYILPKPI
ncbi:response regulator [Candidatus Halobeggiatoa sp. HSG11]|nr:response regulator [Candidatus Halobeggiatoa sp. HSG11]